MSVPKPRTPVSPVGRYASGPIMRTRSEHLLLRDCPMLVHRMKSAALFRRPIGRYDAGAQCHRFGDPDPGRAINTASRSWNGEPVCASHETHDASFGGRLDLTMPWSTCASFGFEC